MASQAAPPAGATIDPAEAAHFAAQAADWWNPKGTSAMLHKLNPVRLRFLRAAIDAHWNLDPRALRPLIGKSALDVGCGAGLLCEPLARLGADVTGVDAAPENIAVARDHVARSGLAVDYRAGELAAQGLGRFDLVTSMEVIEHVTDPAGFVRSLADHLAPGGLMLLSTPNRTPASRLTVVTLAEGLGHVPKGTHEWDKFITPDELSALLAGAGLAMGEPQGINFDPRYGLTLSDSLAVNYIVTATHAA